MTGNTYDITVVNVAVTQAPAPSTLQKTGAFVSQGGSTAPVGQLTLLTGLAALETLLAPSVTVSALSWASTLPAVTFAYDGGTGHVTLTFAQPTGLTVGSSVTISGAAGTGSFASIDGAFTCIAGTSGETVVYAIATGLTMTLSAASRAVPGFVTVTTAVPHGWTVGDVIPVTVAGAAPAGYNVTSVPGTITGASTLTYLLASNPGAETTPGTVALGAVGELLAMGTTFFAQQGSQAVYLLELGEGEVPAGVTALTTFITDNPKTVYSWLVPREWDAVSQFVAALSNYTATNALTYFFVTTTVANRAVYAGLKCVLAEVEAPSIPVTEFSLAAAFSVTLAYSPGVASPVPPLSYAPVFGVTPYPLAGNQTTFTELAAASVGWIATGAEGGLSDTILKQGKLASGVPFNFWYSIDWVQINLALNNSNEVINGSTPGFNPLYYNQPGIDRLQNRGLQTLRNGVSYGLGNGNVIATKLPTTTFAAKAANGDYAGQIVLNADPFASYVAEEPSNYAAQVYGGFTVTWIPLQGFLQVIFQVDATNIVS